MTDSNNSDNGNGGALLQARDLRKGFGMGGARVEVLRGATFSLARGETTAVSGASGSGKSTLLAMLAGLDAPDSGEVRLDGQNISALPEHQMGKVRAAIGIVFQQFYLMRHLSVLENVALPLEIAGEDGAEEKAAAALSQVGLAQRAGHFPHQISGGEAQRAGIARAVVTSPQLLLADEPTGNLDAENGKRAADLLFSLAAEKEMALVLVTHNDALAALCARRLRLREGTLQED